MMKDTATWIVAFLAVVLNTHETAAFVGLHLCSSLAPQQFIPSSTTLLYAKKKKKSGGGGFGAAKPSLPSVVTVAADKNSLEKQWDTFVGVTDLEIAPKGDPEDEDYRPFECADIFVRVNDGTGWYRTGKVVAADSTDLMASMTLQKGLIFWTAVHMWPALVKGKAQNLELGYTSPTMTLADQTDGPFDEEGGTEINPSQKVSVTGISLQNIGFRPDFNPPGFTYKRRERAAMKKKKSSLEIISEAS